MKKINIFFIFCQFAFAQIDYDKYKPVQPLYENGGIEKFYQYLTRNIDFTKINNENDIIIGFVLDQNGKMNHIKVSFCNSSEAENEITSVLQKANNWDLSNQVNKNFFVCYKIKLIFLEKEVKGLAKIMWFEKDIQDIPISKGDFESSKDISNSEGGNTYNASGVEVKPEFPGGVSVFYKFIASNYNMPEVKGGINGKVLVSFVVEKDGSLTDFKILKDIGYGTGQEAIRVLKLSPNWFPAMQDGKPVRCSYVIPLTLNAP